jgi:peptidyl-prolyl cis-trans isomerase B (cyclophilin B)
MRSLILFLILSFFTTLSFSKEKYMSESLTKVKFQTTVGEFTIELYADKAPITVQNFLTYVEEGFYTNTIFHRIIPGFMAQTGGFDVDFVTKEAHANIKIEANNGLKNDRGTLAMARTNVPDSASSQFFINYKNNDFLNYSAPTASGWGYTVFGKVIEGMDTIDKMENVPTGNHDGHGDVPKSNIIIESATVID